MLPPSGEKDWLRVWPNGLEEGGDDTDIIDFGRLPNGNGVGEGEGELRENGLLRQT